MAGLVEAVQLLTAREGDDVVPDQDARAVVLDVDPALSADVDDGVVGDDDVAGLDGVRVCPDLNPEAVRIAIDEVVGDQAGIGLDVETLALGRSRYPSRGSGCRPG